MIANAGCKAPLIIADKVPATKYGHSVLFNFIIFRNEAGGSSSALKTWILLGQTGMYLEKYEENERLIINFLFPESTQGKQKCIVFNNMNKW